MTGSTDSPAPAPALPPSEQYAAWRQTAIHAALPGREQIELTGADRATFLHALTTNHVKALVPGGGCETFFCNAQGKTIGHGYLFCGAESLVIDTTTGQADPLLKHLDRYLIREKVTLVDRSTDWAERLLAGPRAAEILASIGLEPPAPEHGAHRIGAVGDLPVWVRRVDYLAGDAFFLSTLADRSAELAERLHGAVEVDAAIVETARIESGTPLYGVDLSSDNLPQEAARDARAISFVKGCYLGQETVARLDALGHVNRLLAGVRWQGTVVPPAGEPLTLDGKPVGAATSTAWSYRLGAPLGLAYVRRLQAKPGQKLESPHGPAEVVGLPLDDRLGDV